MTMKDKPIAAMNKRVLFVGLKSMSFPYMLDDVESLKSPPESSNTA